MIATARFSVMAASSASRALRLAPPARLIFLSHRPAMKPV